MTRQRQHGVKCRYCGKEDIECPNCGKFLHASSPFSDWLRQLDFPYTSANYDNENLDYIWFQYRQGWFITIEEKMYGAQSTSAQKDTHGIVAQLLQMSSGKPVRTMRGMRDIEFRGHYVISFENTTPDDSAWICIDDEQHDKNSLLYLLRNGELPRGN